MVKGQDGAIVFTPPSDTIATNASHTLVFDKSGYDYAVIDVLLGDSATNGGDITVCKLVEHSSVTSVSSMSAIVPFTGGTVTSSSVGFVIPADAATGAGAVIEFQVDLRKRKKMLGLVVTSGTTAMRFSSIARLTRARESADSAAEKSFSAKCYTLTAGTSVAKIVRG